MPRHIAVLMIAVVLAAQGQVYVSAPSTGSAAPTTPQLTGVVSSGNLANLTACDSSAVLSMTTATTTQAISLQAGKSIYVCGFVLNSGGTTTGRLVQGTGTNCATGQSNLTPAFSLTSGGNVTFGNSVG
ncbi:MAG: hypothetical protein RL328_678, partial [Acidobacteriota bacterium]